MLIDEIEAFRLAAKSARTKGWDWGPPYCILLDEGTWTIHAGSEKVIRISAITGSSTPEAAALDPLAALSIAKKYASENGFSWKPSFSLELSEKYWTIGACQSRFGGQISVQVSHQGEVVSSSVNPK